MTEEPAVRPATVVAFYCFGEGWGRSSAVANVSLILASAGYRVLAADLNPASAPLYQYLAPFLPQDEPRDPSGPVRLSCGFTAPGGSLDFLGPVPGTSGDARPRVGRADLASPGYDYTLIYPPPGSASVPLIGHLADAAVLGYVPNRRVVDRTVRDAQDLRGLGIRLLPASLMIQRDTTPNMSRALANARIRLLPLLRDDRPPVEIPYEPEYFTDDILAVLEPPSEQRDRLVGAYTDLAAAITGTPAAPDADLISPETVSRYRAARRYAVDAGAAVTVLHAPADRYWAEWLTDALRDIGLTAARRRVDREPPTDIRSGSELVVVSGALRDLPGRDACLAAALPSPTEPDESADAGRSRIQFGVSVDGCLLPHERYPGLAQISLDGRSAEQVRADLASYYPPSPDAPAGQRRYTRYPAAWKDPALAPPPPRGTCRGREDEIDAIRDHFTSGDVTPPLALTGPPGIGKSRLALEYAHRFGGSYDFVHVISGESTHSVRAGLRRLARLVPPARPAGDPGRSALRHLRDSPDAPDSWLLIYDGAESAEALAGLLPEPGRGHVLLTCRTPLAGSVEELAVPTLEPAPARDVLLDLVPGLRPGPAAGLSAALGRLPLALHLAGAWLTAAARSMTRDGINQATVVAGAAEELQDRLQGADLQTADEPADSVRVMTEFLLRLLEGSPHVRGATLLLETCAFMSRSGLPRRVFESAEMRRQMAEVQDDLSDWLVAQNVLRTLALHGFTPPGTLPGEPLALQPRVREIIRDRMSDSGRDARSLAVSRLLAESVPTGGDDEERKAAQAELLPHIEPSGAPSQLDDTVREWLVNQVYFLWNLETTDAWRAAADLGEPLAARWSSGAPDRDDDQLLLQLRVQLANVYRSSCQFERARALDENVLRAQRRVLGLSHPRTLLTSRGYGADLRLTGEFEKAVSNDAAAWSAFSDTFGDDHPFTFSASANLAASELMAGDPEIALERQQSNLARCDRTGNSRLKPSLLFHIGTLQRELGRYTEARRTLSEARAAFRDRVAAGLLAPTAWPVLRTDAGLRITQRRLGQPGVNETQAILNECRDTYGDEYPDVLALELSLAGDLHSLGKHADAVDQAQVAREGYAGVFGAEHPFTRICEVNLIGYALADNRLGQVRELSETVLEAFARDLVPGHLWTQAAKVARANVLAEDGRPEDALRLEEEVHSVYRRRLGPANPLASSVAANIEDTRRLISGTVRVPASETATRRRNIVELDTPPY